MHSYFCSMNMNIIHLEKEIDSEIHFIIYWLHRFDCYLKTTVDTTVEP